MNNLSVSTVIDAVDPLARFRSNLPTRTTKFLGEDILMRQLTIAEVREVQSFAQRITASASEDGATNDKDNLSLIIKTIQTGVPEFSAIPEAQFSSLPLDALNKLSNDILVFSGVIEKRK